MFSPSSPRPVLGAALWVLAFVLISPDNTFAGRISLAWDPSPDPVAGYTVYYGTSPGNYPTSVDTTQTTLTIEGLTNGVTYYFVVKAYFVSSGSRINSPGSNEVSGIPANQAPTIANPGPRSTMPGAFSLTVIASDPDGDSLTYSAPELPAGLAINSATGRISGMVSAGTYTITVTVNDGALQASATFTLTATANRAPTLQVIPDQHNDLDDVISVQPVGSDPDDDMLTYAATGLPPGLSLSAATGRITGIPTSVGDYSVTMTVSDGSLAANRSFAWTIVALPPPVPISRWTFDEGAGIVAADVQGPNTGTLANGASWTTGRFGKAVLLDGANDYVSLPTLNVGGSALTIAAWVRTSSFSTAEQRFISKTTGTTNYWVLGTNGSSLRFRLRAGGSNATLTAASTLPANTWYHAAATYDGTTMRLYVNGVQVISTGKIGTIATSASAAVAIGRNPSGTGSNYFNGSIDDMRIFARALTAAEIAVLYEEPLPPPPPPPVSFIDDPLVPGVTSMRLVHITELRTRIDSLRLQRGLDAASWAPLVAGTTVIRASHITEMRVALAAIYAAAGRSAPTYTDGGLVAGMGIKAAHLMELRAAVRALE